VSDQSYRKGFVTSVDGTTIGYRQLGQGPGVILVHGGMQAAQSFMRLGAALANEFCVTIPDRRGRGLSGPYGGAYGVQRDVEDMGALLGVTGAAAMIGLSSGAIIALRAALAWPAIRKLAVYEPPLSIHGSSYPTWRERYDQEVAAGDLAAAMVTVIKGTDTGSTFGKLPRWLTVPLLRRAIAAQGAEAGGDEVPLGKLVPTMHYDGQIVMETADTLDGFAALTAEVLLLGGSKSPAYLKLALARLSAILPQARRVEFPGYDHLAAANDGHPAQVAEALRTFFRAG